MSDIVSPHSLQMSALDRGSSNSKVEYTSADMYAQFARCCILFWTALFCPKQQGSCSTILIIMQQR